MLILLDIAGLGMSETVAPLRPGLIHMWRVQMHDVQPPYQLWLHSHEFFYAAAITRLIAS